MCIIRNVCTLNGSVRYLTMYINIHIYALSGWISELYPSPRSIKTASLFPCTDFFIPPILFFSLVGSIRRVLLCNGVWTVKCLTVRFYIHSYVCVCVNILIYLIILYINIYIYICQLYTYRIIVNGIRDIHRPHQPFDNIITQG